LADGGIYWDIPTETIPPELRSIGCRFVVVTRPREAPSPNLVGREAVRSGLKIERLPDEDVGRWPECNEHRPT